LGVIVASDSNLKQWTDLAVLLFPNSTFEGELELHKKILASENEIGLLYKKDNMYVAFMHLCLRNDYVNGTESSPVLFIEAIYVLPAYRKTGIGREFISYAESFARKCGIKQLASDCYIDNYESERFHKSCGFIEKERVICFAKNV